ncbi:MAG: hypothetical protein FWE35_28635 [Streptosporangiales bacterium]|nr:hypothetical protein [Streptosporangiales bacterium]
MDAPAAQDRDSGEGGTGPVPSQPSVRSHEPEPQRGTIVTGDGHDADLFNVRHYPLRALCRLCGEPITAESFLCPFGHASEPPARLVRLQAPDRRVTPN